MMSSQLRTRRNGKLPPCCASMPILANTLMLLVYVELVLVPDPKLTLAQIAFSIACGDETSVEQNTTAM